MTLTCVVGYRAPVLAVPCRHALRARAQRAGGALGAQSLPCGSRLNCRKCEPAHAQQSRSNGTLMTLTCGAAKESGMQERVLYRQRMSLDCSFNHSLPCMVHANIIASMPHRAHPFQAHVRGHQLSSVAGLSAPGRAISQIHDRGRSQEMSHIAVSLLLGTLRRIFEAGRNGPWVHAQGATLSASCAEECFSPRPCLHVPHASCIMRWTRR